jgi:large subunit ribosomal protein L23
MVDPYQIIFHPYVTEKTMNFMEKYNSLEFVVRRKSTKPQIKKAIEKMFDVQVEQVNTRITKHGKHAIVKFAPEFDAEDIGMRIGVF